MTRLFIVADGDPRQRSTNSGVANGVLSAFSSRADCTVVGFSSTAPSGALRLILALVTFRPSRRWWWATFNLGAMNIRIRSWQRDRSASQADDFDFVLQVRNIYYPSSHPYLVFIDSTSAMANANWAAWKPSRSLQALRRRIEAKQFAESAHIFTAGPQAAASVVNDYGIQQSKVTAVGGGINFDTLPDVNAVTQHRLNRDPEILFVGVDFQRKGGDLLVSAFTQLVARHPRLRLTLVGGRPTAFIPHSNIRILGQITDREEMASLYSDATIFCLPARHEPYGLVLQEAMAFSLPCVATDIGAIASIVDHGSTGLVIPPENISALIKALELLIDQPDVAAKFGQAGRSKAQASLTWDAVASRMIAALDSEKSAQDV